MDSSQTQISGREEKWNEDENALEEIVSLYAGCDLISFNDIPKSCSQELKEEGRDESGAAGQGDFISEDISSPRQLQTTLRPSPQVDSSPTVMVELQKMREEIQRLRHLVILHPRGIPEGREAETRSWTTSLPVYNDWNVNAFSRYPFINTRIAVRRRLEIAW